MEEGQELVTVEETISLFKQIKTLYETVNKVRDEMKFQTPLASSTTTPATYLETSLTPETELETSSSLTPETELETSSLTPTPATEPETSSLTPAPATEEVGSNLIPPPEPPSLTETKG